MRAEWVLPFRLAVVAFVLLTVTVAWGWLGLATRSPALAVLGALADMAHSMASGLLIGMVLARGWRLRGRGDG
jgi:hypothetical protein